MSGLKSTTVPTHSNLGADMDGGMQLDRKVTQAADDGHDADIPSSAGYVLDKEDGLKRPQPIEDQRMIDRDVEKGRKPSSLSEKDGGDSGLKLKDVHREEEEDPNVVWWDGEDDPENPYNWTVTRKALNCGCVSFQTFISPLASCSCT
jgi:hypothetical protein